MRAFLDSNILLYAVDQLDPHKRDLALEMIGSLIAADRGVVSTQSLQEFAFNALRKLKLSPYDVKQALRTFEHLETVSIRSSLIVEAIDLHVANQFHFYDALMIAAALSANCDRLYSEDMQHGQVIRGLRIHNPFKTI